MTEKIKIIYEDNHLLVVEKPINVPSQEDKSKDDDMLTILKKYIKEKYNKPGDVYLGLIHRLDRPVGGVMVFAKTSKAASRLSEQIRENTFVKEYLVIVDGKLKEKEGVLEDYLLKNQEKNMSRVTTKETKGSKLAKLKYEVLKYDEEIDLSVLKVRLDTGRHHQIRVQLSNLGHSIYGDQKYGKRGKGKQINLWAYSLGILHPITKKELVFKSIPEFKMSWIILDGIKMD